MFSIVFVTVWPVSLAAPFWQTIFSIALLSISCWMCLFVCMNFVVPQSIAIIIGIGFCQHYTGAGGRVDGNDDDLEEEEEEE